MVSTSKEKLIRLYGRRKGRKLSDANSLALEVGREFFLKKSGCDVVCMGEGEITINDLLQIKSTGSVNGKVIYGKIEVEDGGKLIGEINYRDKDNKQEEFKDWKAL